MLEYSDGIYAKVLYEFEIFLQVRYQFHFLMLFFLRVFFFYFFSFFSFFLFLPRLNQILGFMKVLPLQNYYHLILIIIINSDH